MRVQFHKLEINIETLVGHDELAGGLIAESIRSNPDSVYI